MVDNVIQRDMIETNQMKERVMKTQISIRIENEILEKIDQVAELENRTRTNLIETAVINYVKGKGVKKMNEKQVEAIIRIRDVETDKIYGLSMVDNNGVDWIADYIGNGGGWGKVDDGLIEYDPENDIYLATTDTIDWWFDIVERQKNIDYQLDMIKERFGDYAVEEITLNGSDGDLESTITGLEREIRLFLERRQELNQLFDNLYLGELEEIDQIKTSDLEHLVGELTEANINLETDEGVDELKEIVSRYID